MADLGRILIALGAFILAAGVVFLLIGKTGLPIGRLPGDIVYRGKNATVYFPVVTCIVLSILLSLAFWIFGKFHR